MFKISCLTQKWDSEDLLAMDNGFSEELVRFFSLCKVVDTRGTTQYEISNGLRTCLLFFELKDLLSHSN